VFSNLANSSISIPFGTTLAFLRAGVAMLKISTIERMYGTLKIRIDGQISGEGVELLLKTCKAYLEEGLKLSVDLENVSFVDREGIATIRKLKKRKVEFTSASPFIAEQIRKLNS
jgi:anti-anti-sigma regulatory factor